MGSAFFASFIAGAPPAVEMLPAWPLDPVAWDDAVRRAGRTRVSPALSEELRRQSASLAPSPARDRNLEALGREGAAAVLTGQQVGLFLGPLYTLHKAATAVARARWLSERTGRPCIPLFWLQTEDHDWAEVARAEVLLPSGRRVLELPAETPQEARVSLAERLLPPAVNGLTAALADQLEPFPHGPEVAALLRRHYRAGNPPGVAFAGVLSELFAEQGLVLVDPRTPAMARLSAPVLRRAIEGHPAVSAALAERARELAARGFAEQVHTRADASLAFFHPRGPRGPRYRLVRDGEGWSTPEGPVAPAEIAARLEANPLWFSTSALLRPLVQDALFPTAAYLGGPAECTYFAQLAPLYPIFGLELPMIAPRARLRVVDEPTRRHLEQLGLRPEDAELPREELLSRLVARPDGLPSPSALRERLVGPMERELDLLLPALGALDARMEENVSKTRRHAVRAVQRLVSRVERAVQAGDRVTANRLDRMLAALCPGGVPQERVEAFPVLAARAGPRALVSALVEAAAPLSPEVRSVAP